MVSPTRRTFLEIGAATAIPSIESKGTKLEHLAQSSITPFQEKSIEKVSTETIDTLAEIRKDSENVTEAEIEQTIGTFCSERHDFIKKYKNGFGSVNVSAARYIARTAGDAIKILQNQLKLDLSSLTDVLEDTLNKTIDYLSKFIEANITDLLENVFASLDNLVKGSARLIPVIGALLGMAENGCEYTSTSTRMESATDDRREKLQNQAEEAKEDFLICCIILVVDIVLLAFGIPYRAAFSGTRKITNTLLWRIRSTVGFDVFSVILKTVHWTIRGTIEESTRLIAEEIDEAEQELENIDIDYSESELVGVGYNESDVRTLKQQTDGDGQIFDDENSINDGIDDESGPLIDPPNLPRFWNNSKDDISFFPG